MLKTLFAPAFQLHDIKQTDTFEITTRWTMVMQPTFNRIMPFKKWWDPRLVFTGVSVMGINPETGVLLFLVMIAPCVCNHHLVSETVSEI